MSNKLYNLLQNNKLEKKTSATLGCLDPVQVIQMSPYRFYLLEVDNCFHCIYFK